MILVFITHAEAGAVQKGHFRALTSEGRQSIRSAAQRLNEFLQPILIETEQKKIKHVISSPAPRCIETIIVLATELSDMVQVDEVKISPNLTEKKVGDKKVALSGEELSATLRMFKTADCVLIGAHGDLARALPKNNIPHELFDGDWFNIRPVIAIMDWDPSDLDLKNAKMLLCEAITL